MAKAEALYVGLMSGTSVDAIDSALIDCAGDDIKLLATHEHPIPDAVKQRIAALSHPGENEIERLGTLDRELGRLFAEATGHLLASCNIQAHQVRAIGSHGQTVRHHPPSDPTTDTSFTLQIGDANTIAEQTGITTIADFRRRDIAAGGEGAPLAPAFHAAAFAKQGVDRAIVNIGGIANATLLEGPALRMGFDTGPGNTLLDLWTALHGRGSFDRDGQWAASGQVDARLLGELQSHSYFRKTGPRSTGKEAFNLAWLHSHPASKRLAAQDVQATLLEFSAATITQAIQQSPVVASEVFVCGGGAHNKALMSRLGQLLAPAPVHSTSQLGMDPDWVEAATFAWLAWRTMNGLAGNAAVVTGAAGPRVLGAIYPGARGIAQYS